MQFLSDENVYHKTVIFLRKCGHGVRTVKHLNIRSASDAALLKEAIKRRKVILSCDTDFINLALFSKKAHYGIIVLKISPNTENTVHNVLKIVLSKHRVLKDKLVVIEENGFKVEKRVG